MSRDGCPVCTSAETASTFTAREKMFGLPGEFAYAVCAACGSLYAQIVPEDLGAFYPPGYGAHSASPKSVVGRALNWSWRRRLYGRWRTLAGAALPRRERDAAILDVGSGTGELLGVLARHGYRDLTGLDPFLDRAPDTPGVRILKQTIEEMAGAWDVVMFHHSLEHVVSPRTTLAAALSLLRGPESIVLVRLPIANFAWAHYGTDWVQLDAPRHTFVPTESGMRRMIADAGGTIERIVYDSAPFQFWGSEVYRSGRTLNSVLRSPQAILTNAVLGRLRYGFRAHALNRAGNGDQAAFVIRKADERSSGPSHDYFAANCGTTRLCRSVAEL